MTIPAITYVTLTELDTTLTDHASVWALCRRLADVVETESDLVYAHNAAVAADAPPDEITEIRARLTEVIRRRWAATERLGIELGLLPPGDEETPGGGV